jgi:hypothetical protein
MLTATHFARRTARQARVPSLRAAPPMLPALDLLSAAQAPCRLLQGVEDNQVQVPALGTVLSAWRARSEA